MGDYEEKQAAPPAADNGAGHPDYDAEPENLQAVIVPPNAALDDDVPAKEEPAPKKKK